MRAKVLDLAKTAVSDRGLNYGKPEDNFTRIARHWWAHLKNRYEIEVPTIDEIDVAIMLGQVKTARLEHEPKHLDSWVDVAGYAACGAEVACKEEEPKTLPPHCPICKFALHIRNARKGYCSRCDKLYELYPSPNPAEKQPPDE